MTSPSSSCTIQPFGLPRAGHWETIMAFHDTHRSSSIGTEFLLVLLMLAVLASLSLDVYAFARLFH